VSSAPPESYFIENTFIDSCIVLYAWTIAFNFNNGVGLILK